MIAVLCVKILMEDMNVCVRPVWKEREQPVVPAKRLSFVDKTRKPPTALTRKSKKLILGSRSHTSLVKIRSIINFGQMLTVSC